MPIDIENKTTDFIIKVKLQFSSWTVFNLQDWLWLLSSTWYWHNQYTYLCAKLLRFTQVKQIMFCNWHYHMVILLLQINVYANLKNRGNFLYLDKMKQKRRKAPCDWKVWFTTKVEQKKSTGAPRRVGLAHVALNIVVFVYRAYNSHAKGTVFSNKVETRPKWKEQNGGTAMFSSRHRNRLSVRTSHNVHTCRK